MTCFGVLRLFGLTLLVIGSGIAQAENWPHWRGPRFSGVSGETNLATTWSKTENVRWRLPLPGPAGASPVVWGEQIFLTSPDDGKLSLLCVSTAGKLLWSRAVAQGNRDVRGDEGNSASPSPTTDGKHVFAFMGTGDLACFDLEGKPVWEVNLQKRYGKFNIQFGMTSSPVLDGDRLYVQCMYTGASYLAALNKATGEEVWKVDRPSDARAECEHSYASPILYDDGKQKFLLTHGADYVVAHRLEDGKELWRCGGLNPPSKYNPTLRLVASPGVGPGLIVVPSAKNGPVLALKPGFSGSLDENASARPWTRPANTPDVPTPVVHEGLVYLCRENGNLICVDAATGEEYYEKPTTRDRHRASPVVADGKVYTTARNGKVTVVKTGKEFEVLATNDLGEGLSSSPAISGGVIYLRTFDALYAIGK